MARKVFISFLGANKYKPYDKVIYEIDSQQFETQYAPEATLNLIFKEFQANDRIYFFLTEDARKYSWDNHTYKIKGEEKYNIGLYNHIKDNFGAIIKDENIDTGKSEVEIWNIFSRIYNSLNKDDEVIFDVTFGFRTSPILMMTLINYAKSLKKIKVHGIYYGAYEARKDNVTPIWNLISFAHLQDWVIGANDFINYGHTQKFLDIIQDDYPNLTDALQNVSDAIETNRGRRIMGGEIFKNLTDALDNMNQLYPPPLVNIVDEIRQSTSQFNTSEDWKNGLVAVQWCIDNKMVQQGITILDELIVTYLCIKHFSKKKDYRSSYKRGIISACLFVKSKDTKEEEWRENLKVDIEKSRNIVNSISHDFSILVDRLSKLRNDINHSGYTKNQEPSEFKDGLTEIFNNIKPFFI